jgi:hypothetical protein
MAPPDDLSTASKELWQGLFEDVRCVTDGPPGAASLLVLEELLRARERLLEVRHSLQVDGITVKGSRGQARPHPLLTLERQLVAEITNSLDRLELRPSRIRNARLLETARALSRG